MIALLLAGGSGTRFWPLSREGFSKQFLKIGGTDTLLQQTFERAKRRVPADRIYVVTRRDQAYTTFQQLGPRGLDPSRLYAEPAGRNTAPAIALVARLLENRHPDEVMAVFPTDHVIRRPEVFLDALGQAEGLARQGYLVLLGVPPTGPETGYGYMEAGEPLEGGPGRAVKRFHEKPDRPTAEGYLKHEGMYWNSGMFVWTVRRILEAIEKTQPALSEALRTIARHARPAPGKAPFVELDEEGKAAFAALEPVSIDQGVLERADRIAMVPAEMGWSDLGTWDALGAVFPADADGNIVSGRAVALDCSDTIIQGDSRLIAALGLNNLMVVDTPDALLVCPKDRAQDVKRLVDHLRAQKREEVHRSVTVSKPWGSFTDLARQPGFLVKRIDVLPGHQLSLQSHRHRAEHWMVLSGKARVELEGRICNLEAQDSIHIPKGARHRLSNPSDEPLVLVEIQIGDRLSENDIIRYQDDYGRTGNLENPTGPSGSPEC